MRRITKKMFGRIVEEAEPLIHLSSKDLDITGKAKYAYLFSTDDASEKRMETVLAPIRKFMRGYTPKKLVFAILQSSTNSLMMEELEPMYAFFSEFNDAAEIKWGFYQSPTNSLSIICMFDDSFKDRSSIFQKIVWALSSWLSEED